MSVKRWNGTAWEVYAGADVVPVKVTDGRPGKTTFIGATSPTGQVDGDIWIDQDTTTNAVVPTALTTKGDTFVATGNAAYTRLAAGNNGESLYADSSTSTGLRWQGDYNVGKNKIINGDMSIAQRGTSFTPLSNNPVYPVDRWSALCSFTAGTFTASQQTFTPGSAPVAGYEGQYHIRLATPSSGVTSYLELAQKIENVRTLAGQTVTLSFWAKSNVSASLGNPILRQTFGTNGSSFVDASIISGSATLNTTTTWQRFSFVYSIPSVAGKTIDTNSALILYLTHYVPAGMPASFTWDLWGVQLEAGSVATPFTTNTANPQAELAACQRYYWQGGGFQQAGGTSPASTETSIFMPINTFNAVPMRATPTPSITGTSYITDFNSNLRTITSVAMLQTSAIRINYDSTKLTSGLSYGVNFTGAGAALILSAEL